MSVVALWLISTTLIFLVTSSVSAFVHLMWPNEYVSIGNTN